MDFGTISQKSGTALYGGQDWQLIERKTFTEAATSYTFSGLTGDSETEYRIVAYVKNGYDGAIAVKVRPNNDDGADHYGYQYLDGTNATASAGRDTSYDAFIIGGANSGGISFGELTINAKSGYVRTSISKIAGSIATTTVGNITLYGQSWNNTADEITSLVILADQTDGLGIGTDLFLFARRLGGTEATSGQRFGTMNVKGTLSAGCFVLKERYEVTGSAATSKTFSGLTGNTNPIYLIKARFVSGAANANFFVRANNDSTAGIYGNQILTGTDTTVAAARDTSETYFWLTNSADNDANEMAMAEMLLYAKSGNVRTALVETTEKISTTTVTRIGLYGQSYNETATEITSLVVLSDQSDGLGVGTIIELFQLNLGV